MTERYHAPVTQNPIQLQKNMNLDQVATKVQAEKQVEIVLNDFSPTDRYFRSFETNIENYFVEVSVGEDWEIGVWLRPLPGEYRSEEETKLCYLLNKRGEQVRAAIEFCLETVSKQRNLGAFYVKDEECAEYA